MIGRFLLLVRWGQGPRYIPGGKDPTYATYAEAEEQAQKVLNRELSRKRSKRGAMPHVYILFVIEDTI